MKEKHSIKILSSLQKEISTNIVINGKKYLILTEDISPFKQFVNTKVYLNGKIISSRNIECKDVINSPEPEKKMAEIVNQQHQTIIKMLKKENERRKFTPSRYLEEVKFLLKKKENKEALKVLFQALKQYPDDAFLLSYYGCLEAVILKNYDFGIETCNRAIKLLDKTTPFGQEIFYPTFYLNLGRAYLSAGKKKEAIESFRKGLSFDKDNQDIMWEMTRLGIRRKPVIPYLKRSNLINKYIGMILHKLTGETKKNFSK